MAADAAPCRYVAMFGGIEQLQCVPSGQGAGYGMPPGLASLESVREHVMLVSGTTIDGTGPSGVTPAGGRTNPHHGNIMKPLLTGHRSTNDNHGIVSHSTPDQLFADVWGTDTHFRSLEYRAQPVGYRGGSSGVGTVLSYDGSQAKIPQKSPQLAFQSLFTGFVPPDADPADLEAQQKLLERKLSVLDLVKDRGDALVGSASGYDRQRLERHFDEIRDLERRLAEMPPASDSADCQELPDPGPDPTQESFPNTDHGGAAGYSGETERANVLVDLIHMALTCDLTRAATLLITQEQSMMSTEPLWGVPYELHDLTHNSDIPDRNTIWNEVTSWHASFFARLVEKLATTDEPTGGTMLDSTAVVLMHTGGPSAHGATNLVFPVAGLGSKLRTGEHVSVSGHPSTVFQTVLSALEVEQPIGELPGLQPAMLV